MKLLKTSALAALLTVCYLQGTAQNTIPLNEPDYNKPKIFTDLAPRIALSTTAIESLFSLPAGASVNRSIAAGFNLTGTVVSTSNPADQTVKTLVVKSPSRSGAAFTFTRVVAADGSITYSGRMFSRNAGDALQIVKDGTGYAIEKTTLYEIVNE